MKRGYVFESDTDTEIIAKLIHHLWTQHPTYSFRELVEQVVIQIVSTSPPHLPFLPLELLTFFFFSIFLNL